MFKMKIKTYLSVFYTENKEIKDYAKSNHSIESEQPINMFAQRFKLPMGQGLTLPPDQPLVMPRSTSSLKSCGIAVTHAQNNMQNN